MRTRSDGNTPWNKLRKWLGNPAVEVILAIVVVIVCAWVVIETESSSRRTGAALPVLFGYK
jgi:hypothetical protein